MVWDSKTARRASGIARRNGRQHRYDSAQAAESGRKSGRARGSRPWTAAEDALLGTATDAEVAATIGRKRYTVQERRAKLGIPAFGRTVPPKQRRGH